MSRVQECNQSINVKLVTVDRKGSTYKPIVAVEDEEDGSITITIEAWDSPSLSFEVFRQINEARKARWHAGATRQWVGPDWGNELAGETGELCNLIKKYQRAEDDIKQPGFSIADCMEKISKEIGDVVICAELIAEFYGLSLEECVRYAFNKTSEKNGFPERL